MEVRVRRQGALQLGVVLTVVASLNHFTGLWCKGLSTAVWYPCWVDRGRRIVARGSEPCESLIKEMVESKGFESTDLHMKVCVLLGECFIIPRNWLA